MKRGQWNTRNRSPKIGLIFWLGTVIAALLCAVWLFLIPKDVSGGVLFGFSPFRLGLIGIFTAVGGISLLPLFFIVVKERVDRLTIFVLSDASSAFLISWLCALSPLFTILLAASLKPREYAPYALRLLPLGCFACFFGLWRNGCAAVLGRERMGARARIWKGKNSRKTTVAFLFFTSALCVLLLMARLRGIGVTPDPFDWQPTGMAVQYWEFGLAFLAASIFTVGAYWLIPAISGRGTMALGFIFIWFSAALIWTGVPSAESLKNSYFHEISPPTNLPFPASDAAYYGLWSESIQAGLGLKETTVSRPLYVASLALNQLITGNEIYKAIDLQTVFLALIPALLFLIGAQLHSFGAGFFAAGIAILREYNSLWLAPHYAVSNVKMFLSDIPMLLAFLLFIAALISWRKNRDSMVYAVLTGGFLGISVLIRSQMIVMIIPLCLLIFLDKARNQKMKPAFFSLLVFAMTISFCVIQGISINGSLIIEDASIHGSEISRRYSDDPHFFPERIAGESTADFSARQKRRVIDFIAEKPAYVSTFVLNHWSAQILSSLLVLPFGLPFSFTANDVTDTTYHNVSQRLMSGEYAWQRIIFWFFLLTGLIALYQRNGACGLYPLIFSLFYMLITALGRYSGWRFVIPCDWIAYFYACAGIFEWIFRLTAYFGAQPAKTLTTGTIAARKNAASGRHFGAIGLALGFIAFGSLPVSLKYIIPTQIPALSSEETFARISLYAQEFGGDFRVLSDLKEEENNIAVIGRMIYPRFFRAKEGISSANPWAAYQTRDFDRFCFVLLNRENRDVILPIDGISGTIRNRMAVVAVGSYDSRGFFRAEGLIFPDEKDENGKPRVILAGASVPQE